MCDATALQARNGEFEAAAQHHSPLGFRKAGQNLLLPRQRTESAAQGTSGAFLLVFHMVFRSLLEEAMGQVRGSPAAGGQLAASPELSFPSANQRVEVLHPQGCTAISRSACTARETALRAQTAPVLNSAH